MNTHRSASLGASAGDYGADPSGVVCGFVFDESGAAQPITAEGALHWLNSPNGQGSGFVWLHFSLSHSASQRWMRERLQLSQAFYEALSDGSRSTRVEMDDDTLVAVVNDAHYDFSFDPADISTLWLSVGPRLVVSARIQPLRSIDRLRDAVRRGTRLTSSVALLVHLMHNQDDVLAAIVRSTTAQVDAIEDKLLAGKLSSKRANLSSLRRVLVRLQRLLAPEPAALFRLLKSPPEWVGENDLEDLRQSTEEFTVALSDMTALQERIKLLQEEIASRVAEANNRSLFLLTMVTVLALPINITAGLMGMNVGGIPFADNPYGFWLVLALVVAITAIAALLTLRNHGGD